MPPRLVADRPCPTAVHVSVSWAPIAATAGEAGQALRSPPRIVGTSSSARMPGDLPRLREAYVGAGGVEVGVVDPDRLARDLERDPLEPARLRARTAHERDPALLHDVEAAQDERAVLPGPAGEVGAERPVHAHGVGEHLGLVDGAGAQHLPVHLLEQHDVGVDLEDLLGDGVEGAGRAVGVEGEHPQVDGRPNCSQTSSSRPSGGEGMVSVLAGGLGLLGDLGRRGDRVLRVVDRRRIRLGDRSRRNRKAITARMSTTAPMRSHSSRCPVPAGAIVVRPPRLGRTRRGEVT